MIVQPRDIGALTYKLRFNNTNETFDIDAPIGIDEMPIKLVQGDKYERHIEYDDSEIEFQPNRYILGHKFDKMIEYYNTYCYEAYIELLTYIDGNLITVTELDFENVTTNKETYFKCKLKNSDLRTVIEKNKDIKVDLLATESLNNVTLFGPDIHEVTLRAKQIRELSSFDIPEQYTVDIGSDETQGNTMGFYVYPFGNVVLEDIDKTNSYKDATVYISNVPNVSTPPHSGLITGNSKNIENFKFDNETILKITDYSFILSENVQRLNIVRYYFRLAVIVYDSDKYENNIDKYYIDIASGTYQDSILVTGGGNTFTVPKFSRVIVEVFFIVSYTGKKELSDRLYISENSLIRFEGVNVFKDTKSKMIRLIDSGISILNNLTDNKGIIDAPRFYEEFREYFVTSGFYIRGFDGESIDIKWSDWLKFIQNAFNCDVQIYGDNIFIGKQEDYYRDIEIARLEFLPDKGDDYEISSNERLKCNSFKIKYNKFEDEERDTLDAFHTESEWHIPSRIKNEFESEINFIADGYSIEYARREGIEAEPTTSKSKDNDIYIVDCYLTYHTGDEEYYYYTNRSTTPGFVPESVKGIYSPNTSYNLRLSLKRLMIDHYSHYLAELSQKFNNGFPDDITLVAQNTFFKANGNLESKATGSIHTYSESILKDNNSINYDLLKQPLVTPEIYEFTLGLRVKYNEIMNLTNEILTKRGYITFYDESTEIKIYPQELEYNQLEEKLKIKGEKKYGL
ncbi:hypothetical protein [Empedobacter brevis]|uniref:hypothetical protein n=1 Tax=Empedobacter brevis TaxID=247 RepID=UPI0028AFD5AC|nr:hypothetical protein [Empedobacter brevis]